MSAFWLAGIAINVAVMAAVVWWAVRNWRRSDVGERPKRDDDRS